MNIDRAIKIFDVWREWFYPCHLMLHTIFMGGIPESFLPYSVDDLNEALTMVANSHVYDRKITDAIIGTRNFLSLYLNDEEALRT